MEAVTLWHLGVVHITIGLHEALNMLHWCSEPVLDLFKDREVWARLEFWLPTHCRGTQHILDRRAHRLICLIEQTFLEEHINI